MSEPKNKETAIPNSQLADFTFEVTIRAIPFENNEKFPVETEASMLLSSVFHAALKHSLRMETLFLKDTIVKDGENFVQRELTESEQQYLNYIHAQQKLYQSLADMEKVKFVRQSKIVQELT